MYYSSALATARQQVALVVPIIENRTTSNGPKKGRVNYNKHSHQQTIAPITNSAQAWTHRFSIASLLSFQTTCRKIQRYCKIAGVEIPLDRRANTYRIITEAKGPENRHRQCVRTIPVVRSGTSSIISSYIVTRLKPFQFAGRPVGCMHTHTGTGQGSLTGVPPSKVR